MRRQESEATQTRTDRSVSIARSLSESADRGIGGRPQSRAGCRQNPPRRIIERHGGGDRASEKRVAHCQYSESIQHRESQVRRRAWLLRERTDGILAVGSGWRAGETFIEQTRESARSRSETSQCHRHLAWAGL